MIGATIRSHSMRSSGLLSELELARENRPQLTLAIHASVNLALLEMSVFPCGFIAGLVDGRVNRNILIYGSRGKWEFGDFDDRID
jgi:hypothetical protein